MIGIAPIAVPGVPVVEPALPQSPQGANPTETANVSLLSSTLAQTQKSLAIAQAEITLLQGRGINMPQADWYFRPQTGSDAGDGTLAAPLKTFAEFVRRTSPFLYAGGAGAPSNLGLHFLEDQLDTSDPVTLSGALHDVPFVMDGGLVQIGAGSFGAVTNVVRATGTLTTALNADGTQPANYWTQFVGMLVNDTTSGTWFRVDKDLGNRKAQLTRPLVGAVTSNFLLAPNPLGAIAQGDQFVIYRHPKVHMGLETLSPYTSAGGAAASAVFQRLHFFTDGEVGIVAQNLLSVNFILFLDCLFDGAALIRTYPEQAACVNCYATGGAVLDGPFWIAGGITPFLTLLNSGNVDGDVIVHGGIEIWGSASLGLAYFDTATLDIPFSSLSPPFTGSLAISNGNSTYGSAALWGPTKLVVHDNGDVLYDGTATTQILCTGGISIAGLATAAKITPGTPRVVTDAVAITVANIDDTTGGKLAGMVSSGAGHGRIAPFK